LLFCHPVSCCVSGSRQRIRHRRFPLAFTTPLTPLSHHSLFQSSLTSPCPGSQRCSAFKNNFA
jgi:hypothetical protein